MLYVLIAMFLMSGADYNAVNPPCAFTPFATCPLPPSQNRLPVRIEAGELAPPGHGLPH